MNYCTLQVKLNYVLNTLTCLLYGQSVLGKYSPNHTEKKLNYIFFSLLTI